LFVRYFFLEVNTAKALIPPRTAEAGPAPAATDLASLLLEPRARRFGKREVSGMAAFRPRVPDAQNVVLYESGAHC
jgi:hypothetical protein